MIIKFKKLNDLAKIPHYAHPGDVGMDVFSLEDAVLAPGERRVFFLGFALEIPEGYGLFVKDKGGPPTKYGVHVMGGVFDAGYRGEYNVLLINHGGEPFTIKTGQKLAQLVLLAAPQAELLEVSDLSDSARGTGRIGSTGLF